MNVRKVFFQAFALSAGLCVALAAAAWTGPTGTAPNNNVDAPINTGSTAQSKAGGLILNTGGAANGLIVNGNVGIGTSTPHAALEVNGTILNSAAYNANNNLSAYNLGVGTVGAQTVYGYTALCTGNASGLCNAASGVVIGLTNTSATVNIPNSGTTIFSGGSVVIGSKSPYGGASLTVMPTNPATWTQLVNYNSGGASGSAYGLYSYGTSYALYGNGPIYSTSNITAAGDVCNGSGKCLSAIGPAAFGGMFETRADNGACIVSNPWTGGCSCPASAPVARYGALSYTCCTNLYGYYCTN